MSSIVPVMQILTALHSTVLYYRFTRKADFKVDFAKEESSVVSNILYIAIILMCIYSCTFVLAFRIAAWSRRRA